MSSFDSERSPLNQPPPTSQYLQEKLLERRARHLRPKRTRHSDFGPQRGRDDDIFLEEAEASRNPRTFDSSPLAASVSSRTSDAGRGGRRRRPPGIRDTEQQLDQLQKANFALKMELEHRRKQVQKMQEQMDSDRQTVSRAEKLEQEHQELMAINLDLIAQMEERDRAVAEAVEQILRHEERIAELEERNDHTRPSTAHADSGYAGTENQEQEPPVSPSATGMRSQTPRLNIRPPSQHASAASQKLQGVVEGQTPAKPKREPSFLSQKTPGTDALRSVYLENARDLRPVKSFQSMLSRHESQAEEDGDDILNSPHSSVLSESSFPTLYSPKKFMSPDRFPWEAEDEDEGLSASRLGSRAHLRQDSIKRVSQWISDRDAAENTPSKSNRISPPLLEQAERGVSPAPPAHGASSTHYQSLNDALASAASKSPELLADPESTAQQMEAFVRKRRPLSQQQRPTSFAGPIFGEPMLPPTPDSASTRMLRASHSSIATDRSLLDTTPAVVKGFDALMPQRGDVGVRTAPRQMRSSVELRTAFTSNLEYRNAALDALYPADSSDDDDDPETVRDLGLDPDAFPDGKSIILGTPRRLLKPSRPPVSGLRFDDSAVEPSKSLHPPRRRQSSDQFTRSASKPRLSRVETSPNNLSTVCKTGDGGSKSSAESVVSPRSHYSASSGNRTIVQIEEEPVQTLHDAISNNARFALLMSPSRSRASPSPARTLSQKTAGLFRRMSNSHGSDRERAVTPVASVAPIHVDGAPGEITRPKTSHAVDREATSSGARPRSSRDPNRPALEVRTKTEPGTGRPPSSGGFSSDKDRRSFFRRSNSHRVDTPLSETSSQGGPPRNGVPKRRGSLRDAVTGTARRPWR